MLDNLIQIIILKVYIMADIEADQGAIYEQQQRNIIIK